MLSWNLQNGPKQQGSFWENMACTEGDHLLAGDSHAVPEANRG